MILVSLLLFLFGRQINFKNWLSFLFIGFYLFWLKNLDGEFLLSCQIFVVLNVVSVLLLFLNHSRVLFSLGFLILIIAFSTIFCHFSNCRFVLREVVQLFKTVIWFWSSATLLTFYAHLEPYKFSELMF